MVPAAWQQRAGVKGVGDIPFETPAPGLRETGGPFLMSRMAPRPPQEPPEGEISISPLLDNPLETTKGQGLRALPFGNTLGLF